MSIQENTTSAEKPFDILVMATDESHLSENCKATNHYNYKYKLVNGIRCQYSQYQGIGTFYRFPEKDSSAPQGYNYAWNSYGTQVGLAFTVNEHPQIGDIMNVTNGFGEISITEIEQSSEYFDFPIIYGDFSSGAGWGLIGYRYTNGDLTNVPYQFAWKFLNDAQLSGPNVNIIYTNTETPSSNDIISYNGTDEYGPMTAINGRLITSPEDIDIQIQKDVFYEDLGNIDAWEIKYCLDNDSDKFSWVAVEENKMLYATNCIEAYTGNISYFKRDPSADTPGKFGWIEITLGSSCISFPSTVYSLTESPNIGDNLYFTWDDSPCGDITKINITSYPENAIYPYIILGGPYLDWAYRDSSSDLTDVIAPYAWRTSTIIGDGNCFYTISETPQNGDMAYLPIMEPYLMVHSKEVYTTTKIELSKGIIYYMKDENGNEAPYDFKNIKFTMGNVSHFTLYNGSDDGSETSYNNIIGSYYNPNLGMMELPFITIDASTGKGYNNIIENGCRYLDCKNMKNNKVLQNTEGTNNANPLTIEFANDRETAGLNSNGELKKWVLADLIQ